MHRIKLYLVILRIEQAIEMRATRAHAPRHFNLRDPLRLNRLFNLPSQHSFKRVGRCRFMEAFLALCLMKGSEPIADSEQVTLDQNHVTVARRGREPGLTLAREGRQVPMLEWARELLDSMSGLCEMLDHGDPSRPYSQALSIQAAKIDDPALTPSARLMAELNAGESFFDLALRMSAEHKAYFLDLYPPNEERLAEFASQARESLTAQKAIEDTDKGGFEEYLARYFAD